MQLLPNDPGDDALNDSISFGQNMAERLHRLQTCGPGDTFARLDTNDRQRRDGRKISIGLLPGAIIGGVYEILEMVGRGGMGEVYLVRHLTLGKKCALKVIPPDQVDQTGWRRFQLEAKEVAKLAHINLVRVTDLGIHDSCLPYYAMDFVEGKTLADLIGAKPASQPGLELNISLDIAIQLCGGLDYAHKHGIIHRDLKPANIIIGPKNEVKILDFGLAKLTDDRAKQSLTAVGDVFGSPHYMSPEQCLGEAVDGRSDIYSLGCTLFECLTGRPPFVGNLPAAIVFSHQEAPPPLLSATMPANVISALPQAFVDSLDRVMNKILAKDPADRYQSMSALREVLQRLKRGEVVQVSQISQTGQIAQVGQINQVAESSPRDSNLSPGAEKSGLRQQNSENAGENANERNGVKQPPYLKAALASLLCLLAGGYYLYENHRNNVSDRGRHSDSPATSPAIFSSSSSSSSSSSEISATGANRPDDVVTTGDTSAKPSSQAMFSQIVERRQADGRMSHFREFTFPPGVNLGYLAVGDGKKIRAEGVVSFPADSLLTYYPQGTYLNFTRYFPRFRVGDLFALNMSNATIPELDAASRIPAIKQLTIRGSESLDDGAVGTLEKFENLRNFELVDADITGRGLTRWPMLKYLQRLTFDDCPDADSLCAGIAGSKNLLQLRLMSAALNYSSFKAIASLHNLEGLHLIYTRMSDEDFAQLSTLPRLKYLDIGSTALSDKQLDCLANFAALNRVRMGNKAGRSLKPWLDNLKGINFDIVSHIMPADLREDTLRTR